MQAFQFIIPNSKSKLYDRFAIFLFLLNAIVSAVYITNETVNDLQFYTGLAAIAFSSISLLYYFLRLTFLKKMEVFLLSMLVIALNWSMMGYWWIGLLMLLLIMLYSKSQREMLIRVTKDNISYPAFPVRIIQWSELNNVVLKDGLLTIDFKNDKIIQHEITEEVKEKDFNDFCSVLLTPNS